MNSVRSRLGGWLAVLLLSCGAGPALAQQLPKMATKGGQYRKLKTKGSFPEVATYDRAMLALDSLDVLGPMMTADAHADKIIVRSQAAASGFPWPPRPCSEQATLDRSLFADARTLGEADTHLVQVLSQAGYHSFRYYPLPQQPGYALVTRFEQIKANYEPLPEPARWSLNTTPCPDFSLFCVAHSLVFPTNGYWRVFVFVVTDRPLPPFAGAYPSSEEGVSWFGQGTNILPGFLRDEPLTPRHYVAVLVYEFSKQEGQDKALLCQCRLSGYKQLQLVGIR